MVGGAIGEVGEQQNEENENEEKEDDITCIANLRCSGININPKFLV
jgi:hypothetical protein